MAATKTLTFTGAAAAGAVVVEVEAQAVKSSAAAGTASHRAAEKEDLSEVILEPGQKEKTAGQEQQARPARRPAFSADARR
jgi:hypothetical protein